MKKENSILIVSAVLLAAASFGAHTIDKANAGYPNNKIEVQQGEFAAESLTTFDNEENIITVKVRTNAPNDSIITIYAQHPYSTSKMVQNVLVKNGKAKAEFEVEEEIVPALISVQIGLDMSENQQNAKTMEVFGANGENFAGENIFDNGDGFRTAVSGGEQFLFPDEDKYMNEMVKEFFYSFVQSYGVVFSSIEPSETGKWNEINVYLTKEGGSEENWKTMTDELLQKYFEYFDGVVHEAGVVGKNEKARVVFWDADGNMLADNGVVLEETAEN